jgi:putative hydrolase of the HAD superfamily
MEIKLPRHQTILFDWGDTIMRDDLSLSAPMVEWSNLEVVEGIGEVLQDLHASRRRIILATSASVSDEDQIRGALERVGLSGYFSHIYCFKNTQLSKGEAFYRHVLGDLGISASEALMVGDSFEKDVQAANNVGMFAVWFNPISDEVRSSELHVTVRTMQELRAFFKSLDPK